MLPPLADLLGDARVVAPAAGDPVPRDHRARGAAAARGRTGWTEFSPFIEYDDAEAATWLAAAIDFGWGDPGARCCAPTIRVNATLPAVPVDRVAGVLARFPGCRTVKVKVAEPGQTLERRRRPRARGARASSGRRAASASTRTAAGTSTRPSTPSTRSRRLRPRVRRAAVRDRRRARASCASGCTYWQIPIAADESVRKAEDPLAVARAGAADLLVIKAQPLGGIAARARHRRRGRAAGRRLERARHLGRASRWALHLAAALPELDYDCGLGTAALLAADVTATRCSRSTAPSPCARRAVADAAREHAAPPTAPPGGSPACARAAATSCSASRSRPDRRIA